MSSVAPPSEKMAVVQLNPIEAVNDWRKKDQKPYGCEFQNRRPAGIVPVTKLTPTDIEADRPYRRATATAHQIGTPPGNSRGSRVTRARVPR